LKEAPINPARKTQFIEAIASNVPAITLLDAVREVGVLNNYDHVRKSLGDDPATAPAEFVARMVEDHVKLGRLEQLFHAIARRCYRDDQCYAALSLFQMDVSGSNAGKQAAIALRANTLNQRKLRDFLDGIESKICVITASLPGEQASVGTGVLVGPDLVLTAFHTLKPHILDGKQRNIPGSTYFAFFDHCDGMPILDPQIWPAHAVRVAFHEDWLMACCSDLENDGLFRDPDADQLDQLPDCLDFALVRLAEPVGRFTRRHAGGARRNWCDINNHSSNYKQDDRIIIPQHPYGHPQQIDFGRYSRADSLFDTSETRIRYNTETDYGTSGAPCFNQEFQFVGLHNASFQPAGFNVRKNQAIRADRILHKLKGIDLNFPMAADASRLWSVSDTPASPRTVIGRYVLLNWIDKAADANVGRLERCYVALGGEKSSGKTFSTEILVAARRLTGDAVVSLGNGDQIPASASDFFRAIGYQLRIPTVAFENFPSRPFLNKHDLDAAGTSNVSRAPSVTPGVDLDKLEKWASDDVPVWFNTVLRTRRVASVDAREEARSLKLNLEYAETEVPPEIARLAALPNVEFVERVRWNRLWIVLDNLDASPLSSEVAEAIAGLMGLHRSDNVLPPELRNIRWLFLGSAPDFLLSQGPTVERLDKRSVGAPEMISTMTQLVESYCKGHAGGDLLVEALVGGWMATQGTEFDSANDRLVVMQQFLNHIAGSLYEKWR